MLQKQLEYFKLQDTKINKTQQGMVCVITWFIEIMDLAIKRNLHENMVVVPTLTRPTIIVAKLGGQQ
jgi:hypothetical protein